MNAHTNLSPAIASATPWLKKVTIGNATLYLGESSEIVPHLNCIDAVVTDPPYGINFMGKGWDYDVPQAALWQAVADVMKPGAHLLSFSSARTYHRLAVQIEDAGLDIRDQLMWIYGSGFPKNHNVGRSITALQTHGGSSPHQLRKARMGDHYEAFDGAKYFKGRAFGGDVMDDNLETELTETAQDWAGWGTALKPAHEPICMARKPLNQSVARNVLAMGTGAINIDGCRVGNEGGSTRSEQATYGEGGWRTGHSKVEIAAGRWPANIIHDGSAAVTANFPAIRGGQTAANFFYAPKASNKDRDEGLEELRKDAPRANTHPTVKPTELMAYLCRLVTPPGGTVLDCFMGSGSTGKAAVREGFKFVGIERDPDYFRIACGRIAAAQGLKFR